MISRNVGLPIKKYVSTVTLTGFISLSALQPVAGFELDRTGNGDSGQIFGVGLSTNFDFSDLKINGFSFTPVEGLNPNFSSESSPMMTLEDGGVRVDMPLLTFGDKVKYPGVFYNHNGTQLYQHVIYSYEGYEESQSTIWPYVVGGLLIAGGAIALVVATNNSDDDSSSDSTFSGSAGSATSSTTSSTTTASSPASSTQVSQQDIDKAKDALNEYGLTDNEIQGYVDQYNNLSEEEKQGYIDQYNNLSEEEKQGYIDEYGPQVKDFLSNL